MAETPQLLIILLKGLFYLAAADNAGLSSIQWKNKTHSLNLYHVSARSRVCVHNLEEAADQENLCGRVSYIR